MDNKTYLKKRTKVLITSLFLIIVLSAAALPADAAQNDTLLAIYMLGTDLEDEDLAASENIGDLLSAWDTDCGKLLVFYGSANKAGWNNGTAVADYENLKKDYAADASIGVDKRHATKSILTTLPNPTASKEGLIDAMQYLNQYAKDNGLSDAHRYIILWGHGGASSGIGYDPYGGISNDEIGQGLAYSDKKFDIIMYDACLMASLEAAYEIKDCGQYMLASEESEPGEGISYQSLARALSSSASKDPVTIGSAVIDGFFSKYNEDKLTYSEIDLSKINNVVYHLDIIGDTLNTCLDNPDSLTDLATIYRSTQKFGDDEEPYSIDLYDFASRLPQLNVNDLNSQANDLMSAVKDSVVISKHSDDLKSANGLSVSPAMSYPAEDIDDTVTLSNGGWAKFLQSYCTLAGNEYDTEYSSSHPGAWHHNNHSYDDVNHYSDYYDTGSSWSFDDAPGYYDTHNTHEYYGPNSHSSHYDYPGPSAHHGNSGHGHHPARA